MTQTTEKAHAQHTSRGEIVCSEELSAHGRQGEQFLQPDWTSRLKEEGQYTIVGGKEVTLTDMAEHNCPATPGRLPSWENSSRCRNVETDGGQVARGCSVAAGARRGSLFIFMSNRLT